jgi:DNA/RNA-binding domain of Phe-tRNA-synthetase-like protein
VAGRVLGVRRQAPSRYPCSAEALAARVLKGGTLPRVNLLVDLYNAVSVQAPRRSGARTSTTSGVACGSRSPTQLTDATTRAFFVLDRLPGLDEDQLDAAASQLESLLEARWTGCATRRIRLDRDHPRS